MQKDVKKVVFCSGKIYYDLLEHRKEKGIKDTAIVRVEQLYPFPGKQLNKIVGKYRNANKWQWVQEEPENMGGWGYIIKCFKNISLELDRKSVV